MSTISKQTFGVGPTIRVRMEYEENQTNFDKNEPIPFGHKVNIQMIKVTGIDAIEYNNSVGTGKANWRELEKGTDIGQILTEHRKQQKTIGEQERRIKQLEARFAMLQVGTVENG